MLTPFPSGLTQAQPGYSFLCLALKAQLRGWLYHTASTHGIAFISDLQTRQDPFLREVIHFMTLSVTLTCSSWNPCYAFSVWDHIGASHFGPALGTLSLWAFTREFTVSTKNSACRKQAHWKSLSLGSIPG